MTLSDRARDWLATLDRRAAPSAERVRAALIAQGVEPRDVWLDFQERYAGYVEPIGRELAVWGMLHEDGLWVPKGRIDVEHDEANGDVFVTCADVHPSYQYRLDQNGELLEGSTASFDVHVERVALRWAFCREGAPPSRRFNVKRKPEIAAIEAGTVLVPEASDEEHEYYLGKRILAVRELRRPRWVEVLAR